MSDHCPAFSNQLYLVPLCCVKPRSYGYVLLLFSLFTFYASKEHHKQLYMYLRHQQLLEKRILSVTRIVREQVGIFPRQPRIQARKPLALVVVCRVIAVPYGTGSCPTTVRVKPHRHLTKHFPITVPCEN